MKPFDIKHIVKDSLREAFYTKKDVSESLNDEEYIIGIVDYNGAVYSQKVKFSSKEDWHHHTFPNIRGDRFRYDSGEVIWTNSPSEDSMMSVDNFLSKRGLPPPIHKNAVLGTIIRKLDENLSLLTESLLGQRLYIIVDNDDYRRTGGPLKVAAVMSRNTKRYESPYRISWFNRTRTEAKGHITFDKEDFDYILETKKLPVVSAAQLSEVFDCRPEDISLEFVDTFNESTELMTEELFGKKVEIKYEDEYYNGVVSKNTKPGELPYRITWFRHIGTPVLNAEGHVDITEDEAKYIIKNRVIPDSFYERNPYFDLENFSIAQVYENLLPEKEILLNEELFGQRLYIHVGMSKYPALISKNTKPNEEEYRISFFSPKTLRPMGHRSFTKKDFDEIMKTKDLTPELRNFFSRSLCWPKDDTFIEFVDKFTESVSNQDLLLLEESVREIESWLDNKILIEVGQSFLK